MIMPLADENEDRLTTPIVNYCLIGLNVFVFVFLQQFGQDEHFITTWAAVPAKLATGEDFAVGEQAVILHGERQHHPGLRRLPIQAPFAVYLTLFTSMFMHGGLGHILGNMLFLWIFGDNVEDVLGHLRYVIYYLLCGVIASLAHVFATVTLYGLNSPDALVPSLGASGAISGVLGGYLVLFPHKRVTVLIFRILTHVPAIVAIGLWFLFQLVEAQGMLGGRGSGGVAYAAHIGGFIAGLALVTPFTFGVERRSRAGPARLREPW